MCRSVASTHSDARGVRCRAFVIPVCFSTVAAFSAEERLWLRAVSAIRMMIAAGTTNRTPARPFLNCESPRFSPDAKFVYNTRTSREQRNSKSEVPQYHWYLRHEESALHSPV